MGHRGRPAVVWTARARPGRAAVPVAHGSTPYHREEQSPQRRTIPPRALSPPRTLWLPQKRHAGIEGPAGTSAPARNVFTPESGKKKPGSVFLRPAGMRAFDADESDDRRAARVSLPGYDRDCPTRRGARAPELVRRLGGTAEAGRQRPAEHALSIAGRRSLSPRGRPSATARGVRNVSARSPRPWLASRPCWCISFMP
jgi:hypothetical protein